MHRTIISFTAAAVIIVAAPVAAWASSAATYLADAIQGPVQRPAT